MEIPLREHIIVQSRRGNVTSHEAEVDNTDLLDPEVSNKASWANNFEGMHALQGRRLKYVTNELWY